MTTSTRTQFNIQRWGYHVLLFWIIGAGSQFVLLWLLHFLFGVFGADMTGSQLGTLAIAAGVMAFVLYTVGKRFFNKGTAFTLCVFWWLAYFLVNLIALLFYRENGMGVVSYLGFWFGLAALAATIADSSRLVQTVAIGGLATATGGAFKSYQNKSVLKSSGFGRIPPSTVILISQHVRTSQLAASKLPPQIMPAFRNAAIELALKYLLKDWWFNENLEGLSPTDEQDIGVFVQYAWHVCRVGPQSSEEALAAFRAVLDGLLNNWCDSWNDQVDGAPPWQR